MDVISESSKYYSEAWSKGANYELCLQKALDLLRTAYLEGDKRSAVVNNYAAVLLDLNMNRAALDILISNDPQCAEFCSNYAIALMKLGKTVDEVREWNLRSSRYPKCTEAIVAYMDWQAM